MNSLMSMIGLAGATDMRATLFPPTSRYHGIELRKLTTADGREVSYVGRRLLPRLDRFETLREHFVAEGERPDTLAAQYIGDAEQFWRVADANNDLNPFNITAEIGRSIRITLPEGIPGVPYA